MVLKICTICGRKLDADKHFHKRKLVKCGYRAACKECTGKQESQARARRGPSTDPLHPLKRRVRDKTHKAVKAGLITPQPCAVCGSLEVEAHHPVYDDKDAHLEVVWLCREHHVAEGMRDPRQLSFGFIAPFRTYSDEQLTTKAPGAEDASNLPR